MRVLRLAILVALLATPVVPVATAAQSLDPTAFAPLLDEVEAEVAAEVDGRIPTYVVDAAFEPATAAALATLSGSVELDYVNTTGADQTELHVRLYPNNPEYADGGMVVERLTLRTEPVDPAAGAAVVGETLDAAEVASRLTVDDTLLTLELDRPLPDGGRIGLTADFVTTVPSDLLRSYGMFRYDSALDVYALAHWFPMLAGIDADGEWLTDPLSVNGDPVFSNAATFAVSLTAPEEMVVVTSGSEAEEESSADDDPTTREFRSGPSRDFVMAASPAFEAIEEEVGGTTVRSYAVPGSEEGSRRVLDVAARSLAVFNDLHGDYLFEELDLVQVPLGGGAAGVEFPGLMYIGAGYYDDPDASAEQGFLEFVVAHEIAHQWWYATVGNNQYEHAFIDESLTNYLTVVYYEERYGDAAAEEQSNLRLLVPYLDLLFNRGGDDIVDQPTDDFRSQGVYGTIVYAKGALGFGALRAEIGDEAFFGALRAYYQDFRFEVATPDDLLAAFETASGEQLDELWRHWFQAAEGAQDYDESDLADLLTEIGR